MIGSLYSSTVKPFFIKCFDITQRGNAIFTKYVHIFSCSDAFYIAKPSFKYSCVFVVTRICLISLRCVFLLINTYNLYWFSFIYALLSSLDKGFETYKSYRSGVEYSNIYIRLCITLYCGVISAWAYMFKFANVNIFLIQLDFLVLMSFIFNRTEDRKGMLTDKSIINEVDVSEFLTFLNGIRELIQSRLGPLEEVRSDFNKCVKPFNDSIQLIKDATEKILQLTDGDIDIRVACEDVLGDDWYEALESTAQNRASSVKESLRLTRKTAKDILEYADCYENGNREYLYSKQSVMQTKVDEYLVVLNKNINSIIADTKAIIDAKEKASKALVEIGARAVNIGLQWPL